MVTKKTNLTIAKINTRNCNGKILSCYSKSSTGTVVITFPAGARTDNVVTVEVDKKDFRALVRGV